MDNQILGTIIASVLDFDQFNSTIGDPFGCDPTRNMYAPCDGRSIVSSKLATISPANSNAPDLRGKFLRGLNLIYSAGEGAYNAAQTDPDDSARTRAAGSYQADEYASHSHDIHGSALNCGTPPAYQVMNNEGNTYQPNYTRAAGGNETRPKNVAVYYYIKIK